MEISPTNIAPPSENPALAPEPVEWQRRSLWVASRLWCGAVAFFFVSFLFAYFYLRSLNVDGRWRVGDVTPSGGLGVAIMAVFLLSGILLWVGARRPEDTISTGIVSLVLAVLGIVLQFVQYTTLGFGPSSGAYASVFIGWTAMYALGAIWGVYWIETQVATLWRARSNDASDEDLALVRAGFEACSFFWAFFVGIGVIMYVVLYLV